MKRLLTLILSATLILTLTACGKAASDTVFTLEKEDGTTETLTGDELSEIYNANELDFSSNYEGMPVTAEGIVDNIAEDSQMVFDGINADGLTTDYIDVVIFTLKDGVRFKTALNSLEEEGIDAAQITTGTRISLKGYVDYADFSIVINYPSDLTILNA